MIQTTFLSNLIGAFTTNLSSQIERSAAELGGRSFSHETALVTIHNHPNETIDVLSRVLDLTHSGAVRLINTLEKEGLVKRHKSQSDGRAVVLCVTEQGNIRVAKILQARKNVTSQILTQYSDEQKQMLQQLLEVAMGNLTGEHIEARRICRLCDEGVCRSIGCPVENSIQPH